jgi:hypothetical protein
MRSAIIDVSGNRALSPTRDVKSQQGESETEAALQPRALVQLGTTTSALSIT